jgi:hypothetical protein
MRTIEPKAHAAAHVRTNRPFPSAAATSAGVLRRSLHSRNRVDTRAAGTVAAVMTMRLTAQEQVRHLATACDQIDRADAMLADLRDRVQWGEPPAQAWPEAEGPAFIARAERDSHSRTVSLILDETTANIAMNAIAAHTGEREAHVREVERFSHGLPDGSYGKQNRQAIAAREMRAAARLRAVERAYQTAADRGAAASPGPASTRRPDARVPDREAELG